VDTTINFPHVLFISRERTAALGDLASAPAPCRLTIAANGLEAAKIIRSAALPDMVLVDLLPGDAGALHTVRWLRDLQPELPIVSFSSEDSPSITEVRRLGVRDHLPKPLRRAQLAALLSRHIPREESSAEFEEVEEVGENLFFVAASPAMRKLRAKAELFAKLDVPVLIVGETGTGKETVAKLIHTRSIRSDCKFLKVNCGALSGDLLESELFGYETTGANTTLGRQSQLQLCDKGTLFLDGVTELPQSVQRRLPDMLEYKEFRAERGLTVESDIRILAATTLGLSQLLFENLQSDVFYGLSAFTLLVPPLRERPEEIPLLLGYFMNRTARQYGLPARILTTTLIDACQRYSWPGNLRELENFVKRYLLVGDAVLPGARKEAVETRFPALDPEVVFGGITLAESDSTVEGGAPHSLVRTARLQAEKAVISRTLEKTRWNRKAAAQLLNISYRGLLYKIEKYKLISHSTRVKHGNQAPGEKVTPEAVAGSGKLSQGPVPSQ
jgi:two-component system, NtrC family, response regulator AtoC